MRVAYHRFCYFSESESQKYPHLNYIYEDHIFWTKTLNIGSAKRLLCVIYDFTYMKSYKDELNYLIKYLIYHFIEKNEIMGALLLMKTLTSEFSMWSFFKICYRMEYVKLKFLISKSQFPGLSLWMGHECVSNVIFERHRVLAHRVLIWQHLFTTHSLRS